MRNFLTSAALLLALTVSAQNVYYEGPVSKDLQKILKRDGYTAVKSLTDADLAVVAADAPVAPERRTALNAFLAAGCGNVIFLGDKAFDYSPVPEDGRLLAHFTDHKDWDTAEERREKKARFTEEPAVSVIRDDKGNLAVEMKTEKDCSKDWFLIIPLKNGLQEDRTVLTFNAKGNEWMDVLSLEIMDDGGKTWIAFQPITCDWQPYALSLADFMPLARKSGEEYEPLKPSSVRKILMGLNMKMIWYEHATYLGISEVRAARNGAAYTAPTSALTKVEVPMSVRATAIPEDIYDPAWRAANPWDVTQNAADTKVGNRSKKDRESRIIPVGCGTVELFPEGKRAGGAVGLFPSWTPEAGRDIVEAARLMTRTPMAVGTRMNMKDGGAQLTVWLRNPLPEKVNARVETAVGESLRNTAKIPLAARKVTASVRILPEIPAGFPSAKFDWSVRVAGPETENTLGGTIDLERALALACRHLVLNQRQLPDGRFSNHFFGDAYGVRAMLIFVDHVRNDPDLAGRLSGLLRDITVDDIEKAAFDWLDMMCNRQLHDGLMMMGYSEPRCSSNVADMGEICTCVFQALEYVSDPTRRAWYSRSFERTMKWMEKFYIGDAQTSAQVAEDWPEETKKGENGIGRYGLGMMGKRPRTYGPIWVNELIMPAHCIIAFYGNEEQKEFFRPIFDRNSDYMMTQKYSSAQYYHAESTFWHWYVTPDPAKKAALEENMRRTMLGRRFAGDPLEPYDKGGRAAMNAMPLMYYQRFIEDTPEIRAVLLKYWWSFAELGSFHAIERQTPAFPKATHGEALASSKFAGHSAIWACEALWPGSTLLP